MVNTSKYKVLGAIAGLGGSCYGSYELYNHYGRKPIVAEGLAKSEETELKEKSSQSVEEASPDVKQLPQIEELNQPEEPQEQQPEQEEPKTIEDVEEKPQPQIERTLNSNGGERTRSFNGNRYNFIDENGSIIIRDRTVGSQFKDYLITSTTDDAVWKQKISFWEEDRKYYQERKKDGRDYTNTAPVEFNINLKQNQILEKEFQKKCYNAYSKPQGRWVDSLSSTGIRGPYNKVARANMYWSIVWKYCGKPGHNTPDGWYAK